MLHKFKAHVNNQFPELYTNNFFLACSGGVDSVVLAYLFYELELDFALVHCNFKLRGVESNSDEDFVKSLAKKLKVPFYVKAFDTKAYIAEYKVSTQMAARELRYNWFAEIMQLHKIKTLVTAHQADDVIETFLINLSRGTGIEGLVGIPSKTATMSRPLLPFFREDILAYAKAENITWREDASNSETRYLRNNIRHKIVPLLKQLHPTFQDNFKSTLSYLSDTAEISKNHIKSLKSELFKAEGGVINIPIVELEKLVPQNTYLYELFKGYGFGKAMNDIVNLLKGLSGKELLSSTHRLVKNRDCLLLDELVQTADSSYLIESGIEEITIPIHLQIEEVDAIIETSKNILYVDKDTLKYPLIVRKWQNGDYFYPFGMQGKKKLSKYFKDEKIDVLAKEKQWLLCSGEAIVWVIGKRADNRFKITKKTNKSLKLTFNI